MSTGLRVSLCVSALLGSFLASFVVIRLAHAHRLPQGWLSAALCVHSHEGSWQDPNPPYFGGLQMDMSFMRAYGPRLLRTKGTADHWTPHEQLDVAYRAWQQRGWYPWPNTARACGLI